MLNYHLSKLFSLRIFSKSYLDFKEKTIAERLQICPLSSQSVCPAPTDKQAKKFLRYRETRFFGIKVCNRTTRKYFAIKGQRDDLFQKTQAPNMHCKHQFLF